MKRVLAACICQTLHFQLKDEIPHEEAVRQVRDELERYKAGLEKNRTKFRVVEETEQEDGSVVLKIIKQYNTSPVGEYLD